MFVGHTYLHSQRLVFWCNRNYTETVAIVSVLTLEKSDNFDIWFVDFIVDLEREVLVSNRSIELTAGLSAMIKE
mgnify:CR=1 FL=1